MYRLTTKLAQVMMIGILFSSLLTSAYAQKKILFVTSNQEFYGNSKIAAANHFEEMVIPYHLFAKAGYTVDFISPKGGPIPIGYINSSDSIQKKYLYDAFFMDKLKHTSKPLDIHTDDYAAVLYTGGGAAMFGVAEDQTIQNITRKIYNKNGVVAAICHGTAGLAYLRDDAGKSLYKDKRITGFPNKFENQKAAYYKTFPFAIDQAIKNNSGNFVYSDQGFDSFTIVDGRFVTGQDPSSASKMTHEIIALIEATVPHIQQRTTKHLDQVFSEWDNARHTPGVAAGLLKDDEIVYLKGFGTADVNHQSPITVDTKFQIGTMSKQFTAFAILLLEEQGKLSLSDDVHKYIPQLPDYGHPITIKHLLSQSSGLSDFLALKEIAGWRSKDIFTQQDALNLILQQKKLDYIPGTRFSQTASGLILLTEVIKQLTGQTFAAFSQQHIFQPLGMKNTLFYDDNELIIPNVAASYQVEKNGLKNNPINYSIVGTTNLYTSAADLSRWYLNFENPKIGSRKLIEKLNLPVTLNDDRTTYNPTAGRLLYGQQYQHAERGVPKFWTYGLEGGYASNIFIFPHQKVTSFVLGNNNRYNGRLAMNMAMEVLGAIFPEPATIDFDQLKTIKLTPQQLETYTGHYWDNENAAARKLYVKNDTLRYQSLDGNDESPLVPVSENIFQMVVDGDDVIIVKFRKEGSTMKMIYTYGESDEYVYQAYQPVKHSPAALNGFMGNFYNNALNTTYTLSLNEKGLFTSNKNQPLISLSPIQKDMFLSSARNLGGIRFARDKQKNITGFYINSDRIKNLFFEKIKIKKGNSSKGGRSIQISI
ncbi:serine hydrolase [Pedobacter sp. N36a]|uniref:serine hydrolase n=1 Tax=Pedobacter sp. N36a TaxID=2767996 RepID=UPI0016572365|nr:serine hydrolase [Pedobacter sp. N36a]MBC8986546.1 serine hydrolase [Pedobacter sp. N36a]